MVQARIKPLTLEEFLQLAIFEASSDRIPVPSFAETVSLTVGQLFGWLQE